MKIELHLAQFLMWISSKCALLDSLYSSLASFSKYQCCYIISLCLPSSLHHLPYYTHTCSCTHVILERKIMYLSCPVGCQCSSQYLVYVGKWYLFLAVKGFDSDHAGGTRHSTDQNYCLTCSAHPIFIKGSVSCPLWGELHRVHDSFQKVGTWIYLFQRL